MAGRSGLDPNADPDHAGSERRYWSGEAGKVTTAGTNSTQCPRKRPLNVQPNLLFQDPDFIKNATAQELSKAAFTSTSTVVRLCQKLECKTYNEFRLRFVAEWEQRRFGNIFVDVNIPFHASDTPEQVLQQLTNLQCLAMKETLALVDMGAYQRAVEMLANADSIDIYGTGINLYLAYDFAYETARIHRWVQISLDDQQQRLSAAMPCPGHCAVVISYSGEMPNTVSYAHLLREVKTPFISITSAGDSSVAQYADERLYIATMEKQFSKIVAFARESIVGRLR